MNLDIQSLLVGIFAGIASAILLLSAGQPSMMSVILFASSALPIFIAGFGWSNQASIAAVLSAFICLATITGLQSALVNSVISLAPAAWIAHLSTLARPASEMGGPDDQLVWYPLPQIMLHIATLMVIATIFIGWIIGYGPELAGQVIDAFMNVLQESGEAPIPPDNIIATKAMFAMLIPIVQSAMWVIILFTAWYFAGHIVRMSGRSKRPKDCLHLRLRVAPAGIFVLFGGLVLTFLSGQAAYIGAAILGGFGAAFMLSGLAVFHYKTVGKAWRGFALWASYISILLFTFPALIFIAVGLFEATKSTPMLVSNMNDELKE